MRLTLIEELRQTLRAVNVGFRRQKNRAKALHIPSHHHKRLCAGHNIFTESYHSNEAHFSFHQIASFWKLSSGNSRSCHQQRSYPLIIHVAPARGRISTPVLFVGRCGRVRGCAVTADCSRWQRRAAAARARARVVRRGRSRSRRRHGE